MTDAASEPLPVGFRDVDATAPDKILRCLDCLQSMAAGQAYKARTLELLALESGASALDVACGLGDEVVQTAPSSTSPTQDGSLESWPGWPAGVRWCSALNRTGAPSCSAAATPW